MVLGSNPRSHTFKALLMSYSPKTIKFSLPKEKVLLLVLLLSVIISCQFTYVKYMMVKPDI